MDGEFEAVFEAARTTGCGRSNNEWMVVTAMRSFGGLGKREVGVRLRVRGKTRAQEGSADLRVCEEEKEKNNKRAGALLFWTVLL